MIIQIRCLTIYILIELTFRILDPESCNNQILSSNFEYLLVIFGDAEILELAMAGAQAKVFLLVPIKLVPVFPRTTAAT